jgi:galactokinase
MATSRRADEVSVTRTARAPGRVNLIGDHTDYTGGLVLPMAIDRWTEVHTTEDATHRQIRLWSAQDDEPATVSIDGPSAVTGWARYVAGVVGEVRPAVGMVGTVHSSVPVGSGLSSSAALEVALALALGASASDPLALAQLAQRAEHAAVGVPSGIMDQLASVFGRRDHALAINCYDLTVTATPMPPPEEAVVVVVHSGQSRQLAGSAYAERVAQCAAAETDIGPLRLARLHDERGVQDDTARRRARHVISENQRVRDFSAALAVGELDAAGALMNESHRSLRDDFDVSTDVLDALCERLRAVSGVFGARPTGAGFGGCVVTLARPGALTEGMVVRAVEGAHLVD